MLQRQLEAGLQIRALLQLWLQLLDRSLGLYASLGQVFLLLLLCLVESLVVWSVAELNVGRELLLEAHVDELSHLGDRYLDRLSVLKGHQV